MYVIDQWLKGSRNFITGRAIYQSLAKDKHVLAALEKGKTSFTEDLLLKELQKLNEQPAKPVAQKAAQQTAEMPVSADPVLSSIREEWMKPYQEMNYLRHKLDSMQGDTIALTKEREPICLKILQLEQECMRAWEKRDHYVSNGKLPDVSDKTLQIPEDPIELANLIGNIKRNIRRNRMLMDKHPDKPVYAQNYNEYKTKFHQVTGKAYEEKN